MPERKPSNLKRPIHELPAFIEDALILHHLLEAYRSRSLYQRNDYIGWITRAKLDETKMKRLNQMLDELKGGDRYMNMPYAPKPRSRMA